MKVSTTSTGTVTLNLPYICRCAFCGAAIRGEEKITAEGHAFKRGYATDEQGQMMKLAASQQANAGVPYEIEYAEKRLAHYREIVASGKLKTFLETGKYRKEDEFRVDPDSSLGNYLLHGPNKTQAQASHDKTRMSAYPYNWKKVFDKKVKCPACGKPQPWCEDLSGEGAGFKAFFIGSGVCLCFLGMVPLFMAGVRQLLQRAPEMVVSVPMILGVVTSILAYKALRKKQLQRLVALPWNADNLPRFDEDFLSQAKAQYEQSKQTGLMS